MSWDAIYLSPHLDDVVLSCGGQIHSRCARGETVLIVTLFAAGPDDGAPLSPLAIELHRLWGDGNVAEKRRQEDREAVQRLGASVEHCELLEALYRGRHVADGPETPPSFFYSNLGELYGKVDSEDLAVHGELSDTYLQLPRAGELVVPLAIGGHVDHRLVRMTAERWRQHLPPLSYYEDFPYSRRRRARARALWSRWRWRKRKIELADVDLEAKCRAILCYRSQLGTVWDSEQELRFDIHHQAQVRGGECLWSRLR